MATAPAVPARLPAGSRRTRTTRQAPAVPGAVAGHEASVRPDDRAGARGPGAVTPVAYRGMLPSDYRLPNVVVADISRPDGFDWGDALIGVLGGAGTALILTGSGFLLLSQRNKARTAQA